LTYRVRQNLRHLRFPAPHGSHPAVRAASSRGAGPPALGQEYADPGGRTARAAVHLAPAEPDGEAAVDQGVEVPVEVPVPLVGAVVEEAAVELDLDRQRVVVDVAVDAAEVGPAGPLAVRARQPVRALDEGQVSVLEDRAGAAGDVGQHGLEPGPPGES